MNSSFLVFFIIIVIGLLRVLLSFKETIRPTRMNSSHQHIVQYNPLTPLT